MDTVSASWCHAASAPVCLPTGRPELVSATPSFCGGETPPCAPGRSALSLQGLIPEAQHRVRGASRLDCSPICDQAQLGEGGGPRALGNLFFLCLFSASGEGDFWCTLQVVKSRCKTSCVSPGASGWAVSQGVGCGAVWAPRAPAGV